MRDPDDQEPLIIAATIILISKDKKALILKRAANEKRFPNLWTVTGGKLKQNDGDEVNGGLYYNAAEFAACREAQEETGIFWYYIFPRIKYLCSIVAKEAITRFIISYYAQLDCNADELHIKTENGQEYKWITYDEISKYDFIPDIGGEIRKVLEMID